MLPAYTQGANVIVQFTLPTHDGVVIAPTSVQYTLHDDAGVLLQARIAVPGWVSGNPKVEIPANKNTLASTNRELRVVTLYMATAADGEFVLTDRYIVQPSATLEFLVNTFMTYNQALLFRHELPKLDGWDAATEQARVAAMEAAHQAICRLNFRYKADTTAQSQIGYDASDRNGLWTYIHDMYAIIPGDWDAFPERFRKALHKAQMIEADQALSGNPIRDKRMDGIVSETVGESKMFFNNRPPISVPISRPALEVLAGFFYYRNRIARA